MPVTGRKPIGILPVDAGFALGYGLNVWECADCGDLIADVTKHERWHEAHQKSFRGVKRRDSNMDFGEALNLLRKGAQVTRAGWDGVGQCIELQVPDEKSKMTLPYLFMITAQGDRLPWLGFQTDLLATDWKVVTDE